MQRILDPLRKKEFRLYIEGQRYNYWSSFFIRGILCNSNEPSYDFIVTTNVDLHSKLNPTGYMILERTKTWISVGPSMLFDSTWLISKNLNLINDESPKIKQTISEIKPMMDLFWDDLDEEENNDVKMEVGVKTKDEVNDDVKSQDGIKDEVKSQDEIKDEIKTNMIIISSPEVKLNMSISTENPSEI